MAQGDLKGTALTATANSIPASFSNTAGSATVAIGDIIIVVVAEQTSLTCTGVNDNLGNIYFDWNGTGIDAGAISGRAFYSIATVAGSLTTVTAACTASANNGSLVGGVFEGPFTAIDKAPAYNNNTDTTSPFTCPATGTLTQAAEFVASFHASSAVNTFSATAPNTKLAQADAQSVCTVVVGYQTVAATTSVAPEFTAASGGGNSVQGTASFKFQTGIARDPGQGNLALSPTAPTAARTTHTFIYPPQSNLALSPTVPTAAIAITNRDLSPARRDLALSPTAPTAARTANIFISPPQANLVLSPTAISPFIWQSAFRFRSDTDGVNSAPTWAAAENVAPNLVAGADYRVRIALQRDVGSFTVGLKLQSSKNGGALQDVTQTSSNVKASATASTSPDKTSITVSRLTGSGSFVNGEYSSDGSPFNNVTLNGQAYTEFEFGIQLVPGDVSPGDTIAFRLISTSITIDPLVAVTSGVAAGLGRVPSSVDLALSPTAPTASRTRHVFAFPASADLALSPTAPSLAQGTTVSASPASANLVLSSAAPDLASSYNISPASGNLLLSSVAPSRVTDHRRDPASGNLSLSTTAGTVAIDLPRSPASANLALSPTAPGLRTSIQPAAADLTLSTTAPTAAISNNKAFSPATDDLALSASAPGIITDVRRDPASGNLSLSTSAGVVLVGTARNPGSGDLVLTGTASTVALSDNRVISPSSGNLALSATDPAISQGTTADLSPSSAQLALSASIPSFSAGGSITYNVAAAPLSLSGFAPQVTVDFRFDIPAADLLLSPIASSVAVSDNRAFVPGAAQAFLSETASSVAVTESVYVSPTAGDLALSVFAPAIAISDNLFVTPATAQLYATTEAPSVAVSDNRNLIPATGNIVLSGTSPAVSIGFVYSVPANDLSCSPTAPTVGINLRLEVVSGSLLLTGFAPNRPTKRASRGHRASPTPASRPANVNTVGRTNLATGTRRN